MIVNITTLKNHLENHKISGNDAIAIMTVIRKQLEHDKRKGDFQWLNHFCNWCLHPKLNRRIISVDIINSFIRAFFQVKKFNFAEVTPSLEFKYESDRESINEYFDSIIGQFRTELKEFLNIYHINTEFIKTDENFILFFARVFYIVKNSPLEVPDIVYVRGKKNLQKIEEYNELCTSFYKKWIWSKGVYISPDFYPIRISISHSLDGSFGLSVKTKYGSSLEFNPITYHGGTFRVQHEAVNINFNRGNVLIDKGELEKAKTAFQQSINIWPTSEAYGNLSSVLSKLGDHDEALTAAEKAIELNPDDHIAWINKSQALNNLKRYDEGLIASKKAISLNCQSPEAWCNKSAAHGGLKQYEDSLSAAEKAIKLKTDYVIAWSNKIHALIKLGRKEEAKIAIRKAEELQLKHK